MTTHILHHANCPDGVVAYLIAAEAVGEHVRQPMNYGHDLPAGIKEGDDIVIVDFCPPAEQLEWLADGAASITLLDHHATALNILTDWIQNSVETATIRIERSEDLFTFYGSVGSAEVHFVLDQNRSGAGITWDHYCSDRPMPALVAYTQDKDLWRHELPDSRKVGTLLNALPKGDDLSVWGELANASASELIEASTIPWMMHEEALTAAVERSWWVEAPNGDLMPVTVCEYRYGSSVAEALTQANDVPLAMYFTPGKPGDPIRCGVRGPGSRVFDELWGGGGHDNAAGFSLESWQGWEHQ